MIDLEKALKSLGLEPKRVGRELFARCPHPEHPDKNPSWRMRDEPGNEKHGRHMCWSCGFKGEIVGLAKLLGNMTQEQAEAWVGTGEAQTAPERAETQMLHRALSMRRSFTMPSEVHLGVSLHAWPATARDYVQRRGITAAQVVRWGVGFAVAGRLAGRIVFPKRFWASEAFAGYSARTFVGDEKRYYEPRPDEGATPGVFFGEEHWSTDSRALVVTEGAINALAWERAVRNVSLAALSGSEITSGQLLKIGRFARVVVATDSDAKGDLVAAKITGMGKWVDVRRLRLPPGPDAAEVAPEVLTWAFEHLMEMRIGA